MKTGALPLAIATVRIAVGLGFIAGGCGGSSARVLERIDAAAPPTSNLRVDVFLVRSVSSCAVGSACTRDTNSCFYLADAAGPQVSFNTDALQFVPPGAPEVQRAPQARCFNLTLDDAAVATTTALMTGLRARVFQASGGDLNLDIRYHEISSLEAGFSRYYTGIFLATTTLEPLGLSMVNRETDFSYAITGYRDPDTGLMPKMEHCAGTNGLTQGIFGGSSYTWLATEERCTRPDVLFSTWMIQFYLARREVAGLGDIYVRNNNHVYPACGQGDPDPTRWFPQREDCTTDPDFSAACGRPTCPDEDAFLDHVVAKHWPRGQPFNGNHCANGRMDIDETGVDVGGTCDLIGR